VSIIAIMNIEVGELARRMLHIAAIAENYGIVP